MTATLLPSGALLEPCCSPDRPEIGMPVEDLDTPVLCIDLDVLTENIRAMAGICRQRGLDWRPHSKAHKSPEIARRELAAGAIGVTCAKLGEAEVMAAAGIRDILIAYPLVGPHKMRRLAALSQIANPVVAVDDAAQVLPISQAVSAVGGKLRVIVEVDIGLARSGIAPGEPTLRLAELIARQPGLELAGIMGYEGHLMVVEDRADKSRQIRQALAILVQTRDQLLRAGLPCPLVSAGGTGSFATTVACPGITELQAGGVIFMDSFYRTKCQVGGFGYALKLIATIVSRPTADRAILDAGRKTHFADNAPPIFVGQPGVKLTRLSAEHGQLELSPEAQHLKVGDRLTFVPGYSDFTNVLHDEFVVVRQGRVVDVWPLVGRGKLK